MECTVIDIRGDYAFVRYDDTGVVSEVAIALLPFGIDVGDRLKFENQFFCTQVIQFPVHYSLSSIRTNKIFRHLLKN